MAPKYSDIPGYPQLLSYNTVQILDIVFTICFLVESQASMKQNQLQAKLAEMSYRAFNGKRQKARNFAHAHSTQREEQVMQEADGDLLAAVGALPAASCAPPPVSASLGLLVRLVILLFICTQTILLALHSVLDGSRREGRTVRTV